MKKIIYILIGIGVFSVSGVFAWDWNRGVAIPRNNSIEVANLSFDKGKWGLGYRIKNTGDKIHFIPTKQEEGWKSFVANKPSDIVIEKKITKQELVPVEVEETYQVDVKKTYVVKEKVCYPAILKKSRVCKREYYNCGKTTCVKRSKSAYLNDGFDDGGPPARECQSSTKWGWCYKDECKLVSQKPLSCKYVNITKYRVIKENRKRKKIETKLMTVIKWEIL